MRLTCFWISRENVSVRLRDCSDAVASVWRYVKKTGVFNGAVSAENICVEGVINADIETETLHLKATGIIDGDVYYRNIIIESGGILKSQMVQNMSKINNLVELNKKLK